MRSINLLQKESMKEEYISVPKQGRGKLILEIMSKSGHFCIVEQDNSSMIGVYKLDNQVVTGTEKFDK
ncbi:hypothetical protein [Bacillus thuringiensis]|uniref:hypothetical protein n=1 Tax=Bacillus thuringiensis TaxID=1428 RepID=UPI00148388BA|nr:hypothetical protein [Bacillus thuringiensis]